MHVAESVYDLGRWIDLLPLPLVYADAGTIGIEDVLSGGARPSCPEPGRSPRKVEQIVTLKQGARLSLELT